MLIARGVSFPFLLAFRPSRVVIAWVWPIMTDLDQLIFALHSASMGSQWFRALARLIFDVY
jgi:hypothetical protein